MHELDMMLREKEFHIDQLSFQHMNEKLKKSIQYKLHVTLT